jgi:hypothetical protein
MIALTLLTTVLVALGGLMFQAARHTRQSAAVAYRSAASTTAAAWVQALPWDSIAGAVGCSSDSSGALAYDRCVTVQNVSAKLKRVTITITPTGTLTAAPDTIVISRVRPRPLSTLRSN